MRVQDVVQWTAGAAVVLTLMACGGGGNGTEAPPENTYSGCLTPSSCGSVVIAVTDADTEFLSYAVDVRSLTLKQSNGDTAKMLPVTTRIDLAQAADLAQSLTFVTVPNGAYTEGTLELDYTNAEVTVESNGQQMAARVVGADGSPVGVVHVPVALNDSRQLTIVPGSSALLAVDFDLAAANSVDLSAMTPIVTVTPSLIASMQAIDE
ncbi:MAG TPA: DUF4382 domain-containing protein [Povalibacter sp.]